MRYINKMLLRFLFLLPTAVFAGRSLVMTPANQGGSINDPNLAQNQSWRVEFQMHDWTLTAAGNFSAKVFELDGVGAVVFFYPDGTLATEDHRDSITPAQPCFLSTTGRTNVEVRIQRDVSQMRLTCEIWNYDGTGYASGTGTIVNTNPYTPSGGFVAGGATTNLAYLRVFTTIVPLGSRPPTMADGGNWTELKFENNLNDSSGHGHSASVPGATYTNTPNQIAIALPKTFGAPAWNNWTSLRAGYPAKLDGSASYSLADASSAVSYFWQQVSGPSLVRWSDRSSATPIITGLVFGTYTFSLRVSDAAGTTATVPLLTGAVATDNNGVVIPADLNVEKVYGPMIAFGQNPWGYADERHLAAVTLQLANNTYPAQAAQWSVPASGTISYPFAGKGPSPGVPCTTLSAATTATALSLSVTNASCLSLSSLPTWILIGNSIGAQELVRIVATTATSGPATLTVGYDGRGMAGAIFNNAQPIVPAQAWPAGTIVGEMRIQGTGTSFATDAARPICPAGAPGPPGAVTYSTGTVSGLGGSRTLTGNSTAWTQNAGTTNTNVVFLTDFSNNAITQQYIRVTGTHGGGIPFVFWAFVTAVAPGNGSITVSRPLPADFDTGNFNYKITATIYWSLEFVVSGNTYRAIQQGAGCESETAAYRYRRA